MYIRGRGNVTLVGATDEVYSTFSGFILRQSQRHVGSIDVN